MTNEPGNPEAAGGLIIGAAYPDFVTTGLREVWRAYLGADDAGTPDVATVEARLGELADPVKSLHPGGGEQWRALVQQSARMWLAMRASRQTTCTASTRPRWYAWGTATRRLASI